MFQTTDCLYFFLSNKSLSKKPKCCFFFISHIDILHTFIYHSILTFFILKHPWRWNIVSLNNIYQWMIHSDRQYKFYLLLRFITSRCLYRSISPNTTSKVPMIATISANMWFFPMWSTTARWANPGALILHL